MEKTRILCFGDSLTWGFDPVTRTRLPEEVRWPGVLQRLLEPGFTVIEEAQNGRTIATERFCSSTTILSSGMRSRLMPALRYCASHLRRRWLLPGMCL